MPLTLKQRPPKRVSLIFPPAMHPTSPPLGVASLLSYLSRHVPQTEIKIFDLNLAFFETAMAWMKDGRLKLALKGWTTEETTFNVLEAVSFIRGEKGMDAFCCLAAYQNHAGVYQRFEGLINGLFENFARRLCLGMALPPLAASFFAELVKPVLAFKPDLTGFSILFSQQLYYSLALAKLIKMNGIKVILGGATLSVMPRPESLLAEPVSVMLGEELHPLDVADFIDGLIVGEGEIGLAAVLKGRPPTESPGLVYRLNGAVRKTPPRMPDDLGALPAPDFKGLPLERYHSPRLVLPYLSARGCFWGRCSFCTHQKTYLAYREEPVERTIEKLSLLQERHQNHHFSLVDEMVHPNRMAKLANGLLARGLKINFSAYAKPTAGFSAELLENAHQAGLRMLMWGVESGSKRVLDVMRKGTNPRDMGLVLERSGRTGVWNLVFAMFGYPSESAEEWEQTLSFLETHAKAVDGLSKSRFLLLAGSRMIEDPKAHGLTRIKDRPRRDPIQIAYDYQAEEGLSQDAVRRLYDESRERLSLLGRSRFFGVFRDHMLIYAGKTASVEG